MLLGSSASSRPQTWSSSILSCSSRAAPGQQHVRAPPPPQLSAGSGAPTRQRAVVTRYRPEKPSAQHDRDLSEKLQRPATPPPQRQQQQPHANADASAVAPSQPPPAAAREPEQAAKGRDVAAVDEDVRVIGIGQRGISAAARLMGNPNLAGASFIAVDTDAKVLSGSQMSTCIAVPPDDDTQLTPQQLAQLAGAEVAPAAAAGRASTLGASSPATNGVAFLLAAAGGIPGGSTLLLQVASHMRRAGLFVVVALTRPFEFEGRRKIEEASALVEALQDVANLVVVVPQAVLTRASAELTITQALEIADITLETSCRAVLWALGAPEVLLASSAGMLWHGRDLRNYKRLLSPPMEMLGTCPGVGHLGRGFASLPLDSLAAAGLASGLSTLAEDAVLAAADSPFLEHIMPSASGVLCVLSLPPAVLGHDLLNCQEALNHPGNYAIRAAVQVAAATAVELVGGRCDDVVVCAHVRHDWSHADPATLCMEATLLVLEDPAAAEEKEETAAARGGLQAAAAASPAAAAAARVSSKAAASGPLLHSVQLRQNPPKQRQQEQQQQQQQPQAPVQQQKQQAQPQPQEPAQPPQQAPSAGRTWRAMSALASSSAAAAVGKWQQRAQAPKELTQRSSTPAATPAANNAARQQPPLSSSNSGSTSRAAPSGQAGAGAPRPAQPRVAASPPPDAQQQQQPTDDVQLLPRLADKYVDTMVAQSLDLPPSAARWRHHQRRQNEREQARRASGHFAVAAVPWSAAAGRKRPGSRSQGGASAQGVDGLLASASQDGWEQEEVVSAPRDVKSRVAGMLEKERFGSCEEDDDLAAGGSA